MISLFSTFFRSFFVHFVEFIVRLWFSNRLSLRFQRYRAIPHVHLLIFKPNSLADALPPEKKRETQLRFLFFFSLPFYFSSAFHRPLRRTRISFIQFRCLFRSNTSFFKSKVFSLPSFLDRWLDLSKSKTHDFVLSMFLFLPTRSSDCHRSRNFASGGEQPAEIYDVFPALMSMYFNLYA